VDVIRLLSPETPQSTKRGLGQFDVDPAVLQAWLNTLNLGGSPFKLAVLFSTLEAM